MFLHRGGIFLKGMICFMSESVLKTLSDLYLHFINNSLSLCLTEIMIKETYLLFSEKRLQNNSDKNRLFT